VVAFANGDPSDALAMHALRIRWKRLRYTAELFSEVAEKDSSEAQSLNELSKRAARMQKRLGELHDFDEAIVRLRRAWGMQAEARTVVLRALAAARVKSAQRAHAEVTAELASWASGV
jgi:CHAD domain-containing protein